MIELETDVLIVGSGGAGMYAALEAAKNGASVILADRSLIGRGGGTVMAMMTVAAAIGQQTPDSRQTISPIRSPPATACATRSCRRSCAKTGRKRILEMDSWHVGWARENGHIKQAHAPGHDRPRCVYVDFLSTGPAVSKTLRHQMQNAPAIRRIGDLLIVDIALEDGVACGATAVHVQTGEVVTIAAKAVVIATGGLTRLYRRNSASLNMGGDGYALALRAGARTDRHGIRAVLPDRTSGAAARRARSDHVGSVPLQARRQAAQWADAGIRAELRASASAATTAPMC